MNWSRDEQRLGWCLDYMLVLYGAVGNTKRAFSDSTVVRGCRTEQDGD